MTCKLCYQDARWSRTSCRSRALGSRAMSIAHLTSDCPSSLLILPWQLSILQAGSQMSSQLNGVSSVSPGLLARCSSTATTVTPSCGSHLTTVVTSLLHRLQACLTMLSAAVIHPTQCCRLLWSRPVWVSQTPSLSNATMTKCHVSCCSPQCSQQQTCPIAMLSLHRLMLPKLMLRL